MSTVTLDPKRVLVACEALIGADPKPPFSTTEQTVAYQIYCLAKCADIDVASGGKVTVDEHVAVILAPHFTRKYPVDWIAPWDKVHN